MEKKCSCFGTEAQQKKLIELMESAQKRNLSVVDILENVQSIYGYLPKNILLYVASKMNVPISEIYGVATFYAFFRLVPTGKHTISVCLGTACYVKGSQLIFDKLCDMLKIGAGETTADGMFTLDQTRCMGCCGQAPVMSIDDRVFSHVELKKLKTIIDEYYGGAK